MKKFILILAILSLAVPVLAVEPIDLARIGVGMGAGVAAATCPYDYCESLNSTTSCADGYSSTCNYTWTVTKDAADTIDFDNAAAPAPLEAGKTYGLRMTSANTTGSNIKLDITDGSNGYMFFIINFDALGSGNQYRCFAGFVSDASADVCFLCLNNANPGKFATYNGTGFGTGSASAASVDTTYYIWLEHVKNTSCNAYISTDTTKPETPTVTVAGKNADIGTLMFQTKYSTDIVFGKIRKDDGAIGSSPN